MRSSRGQPSHSRFQDQSQPQASATYEEPAPYGGYGPKPYGPPPPTGPSYGGYGETYPPPAPYEPYSPPPPTYGGYGETYPPPAPPTPYTPPTHGGYSEPPPPPQPYGQTYGYQEPSYGYGHPAPAHGQSAHGSHAAHDQ